MPKAEPNAEPKLMTVAQYAKHRNAHGLSGGTPQAVRKALQTGRIDYAPAEDVRAFLAERDQDGPRGLR